MWAFPSHSTLLAPALLALLAGCSPEPPEPASPLAEIAATYKLAVVTADLKLPARTAHGAIDGKPAGEKELRSYADLFVPEFSLYPPALVRKARLKRVVLCVELSFAGQLRGAIPDWEHDTLYLDVRRGAEGKVYLRKVLHHEFFHMIDYRDDGLVYEDERWAALNPAGFKYGRGGRAAQDLAETSVLTDKLPGFLNHYSTTGVEEDKAELFANLIADPDYVAGRAEKERVLRAKVERMKELLADFCPEVDAEFWANVRTVRRGGP